MIQAASKIVNSTLEYPSSTLDRGSLFPERTILLSVAVPWISGQMQQEREQKKEISLSGTAIWATGSAWRVWPKGCPLLSLCSAPTWKGEETWTKPTCRDANEAYGNQLLSHSRTFCIKPGAACTAPVGNAREEGLPSDQHDRTPMEIFTGWLAKRPWSLEVSIYLFVCLFVFEKGGQKAGKVALSQTGSFTTGCSKCDSLPVRCSLTALQHHGEAVRSPSANCK